MTHQTSSPETHATPTSPNESSCTAKVPNCTSGGQAQAPPAPNADLQMTENRVADSQDVEDISCKNTCDDSSSREIVNQTLDSPREPTPEESNNCKESSNEKETEDNVEAEEFSGQIVYNPDGSAFILEESDEALLDQIPTQEGAIVERAGKGPSSLTEYPKIDQTVYVARRRAWYNAMGTAYRQMIQDRGPQSPIVHNFRVVSVAEAAPHKKEDKDSSKEHSVHLGSQEREVLNGKDASAILQVVGADRRPMVSLLEAVGETKQPDYDAERNNSSSNTSPLLRDLMLPLLRPPKSPITIEDCQGKEDLSQLGGSVQASSPLLSSLCLPFPPTSLPHMLSMMSPGPGVTTPTNASQLQGTTIGPCPDHVTGRQPGVECEKCDFILNASKLGEESWAMARNANKALKCPKCNWHYKYQETLEVHMKDKHPESNAQCIYCITNQQHPRLARGETYTCGYKPYRCEVCNYSTTTKGNLSIHMQSDKHINNMQELQNGGIVTAADGTKISQSSLAKLPLAQRLNATHPLPQQNSWRCDVCNYETSLPRNLRIHMTSDKHIQNITSIQQNMKQLQGLQMLQSLVKPEHGGHFPGMPPLPPMGDMNHMMMMDLAHNQALFLQLMASRHNSGGLGGTEVGGGQQEGGEGDGVDPNPNKLFNCCICQEFGTDSLETLSAHLAVDRSCETGEGEVTMNIGGTHICKLCTYKTNLKANFQLHSKTDKHLARLSLFNHIREGGPANEWKLNMLAGTNPIQLRCNACDYNTNSLHKLQAHVHVQTHDVATHLFTHLCKGEAAMIDSERAVAFNCVLCRFSTRGKATLMLHSRSLPHIRAEQLAEGRRQAEGGHQPEVGDIFTVGEAASGDGEQAESSETESQRDRNEASPDKESGGRQEPETTCPLCQEPFPEREALEEHALSVHQVPREGLQRLVTLVEGCQWLNKARSEQQLKTPSKEVEEADVEKMDTEESNEVASIGAISEKHVYKYRCSQCSLAFKTQEKLETHSQYHQIRDSTKCKLCDRSFRTVAALLKHIDTGHSDTAGEELEQYRQSLLSNPLLKAGLTNQEQTDSPSLSLTPQSDKGSPQPGSTLLSVLGSLNAKKQLLVGGGPEEERPYKCNICSVQYGEASALDIHIRSSLHSGRASRLQQLVADGQVDLNKPLIEQPEMEKTELGLLSPQSNASNSSNSPTLQKTRAQNSTSPFSSPQPLSSTPKLNQSLSSQRSLTEMFANKDSSPEQLTASLLHSSLSSSSSSSPDGKADNIAAEKKSSPVMKTLLQNYGFDLVMQFNESHQRRRLEERLRLAEKEMQNSDGTQAPADDSDRKPTEKETGQEPTPSDNKLPELRKSKCPLCQKEFSSIWVLKAHTEEVHKVVVPPEFLQKYVEELRLNMDQTEAGSEEKETSPRTEEGKRDAPEDGHETSEEGDQTKANQMAGHSKAANEVSKTGGGGMGGIQHMMREAVRSMQEQNQSSFTSNSGTGSSSSGAHNLLNMNLHPPLIPPGMIQPPGADPFTAALLLQAATQQKAKQSQQNSMTAFENQILTKLGIDPEVVKQAGLDPKFLIHLANMDPKAALDPKVLAMMSKKMPTQEINFQNQKMRQLAMENKIGFFPGLPQPIMSHQDPKIFNIKPQQFVDHGQKRARTRITDDQLKILRSNFDINNSPSEEQTNEMAAQTGLPPKVIKHWFRNTLFKERQRNKDSPYNFNNPPSTLLNLEEYEKTGVSEVIHLNQEEQREYKEDPTKSKDSIKEEDNSKKEEEKDITAEREGKQEERNLSPSEAEKMDELRRLQLQLGLNVAVSGEGGPHLPNPFDTMFNPHAGLEKHPLLQSPLGPGQFPGPLGFMPPGHPFNPSIFDGFGGMRAPSPASDHPGLSMSPNAKRANRTRFTDYQIKVLQEFFENNAYPKDDDLEYLSKLLSLSPRVIVVWFQNARQKARKIYENQPSLDPDDEGAGRFTRTPGLNYQCKKCLLVFQRYYELIRHQKQHCFKEEDAKRSAQAQKAAAHAAASFVGQVGPPRSEQSQSPGAQEHNLVSPLSDIRRSCDSDDNKANQASLVPIPFHRLLEEKKTFGTMFEKFSQEERVIKFINEANQLGAGSASFPISSPFAMLQKQAAGEAAKNDPHDSDDQSMDSFICSPTSKRKMSDDTEVDMIERDENGQPKDKRLRTTILPEQLDYLYQKYQLESNPSRKMLEQIAAEVGLRKRVVQVWFQNTRARERKGQFRAHQQVINKRCPFCPALFKVRSALESHLATKHSSQYTRGDINIDSLPDASVEDGLGGGGGGGRSTLFPSIPCPSSPPPPAQMPPLIPNNDNSSEFEASMRKYYEDTMKQFISDVNMGKQMPQRSFKPERSNEALDLSSPPLKHNNASDEMAEREEGGQQQSQLTSPGLGGPLQENQIYDFEDDRSIENGSENGSNVGQPGFDIKKRYRTQMSTVQVKLMKHVFELHKTPTMGECLALAQLIGLQKRVVQVWFQNARAKEKKARLNLQQITGKDAEPVETPEECKFCSRQYQNKFGIQEHIFDREHLDNVRKAIEGGNYEPETPGYSLNQKASALYKANNGGQGQVEQGKEEVGEELPPPPPPPPPPAARAVEQQAGYGREVSRPGDQFEDRVGQVQPFRPDQQQPHPPTSFPDFPHQQQQAQGPAYPGYRRQQQGYEQQYYSGMATYHPQHHYPAGESGYPGNYHPGYDQGHLPPPPHTFPGSRHYPHMYPAGK